MDLWQDWLDVADRLRARGVQSARQLSNLTGLGMTSAERLRRAVMARWREIPHESVALRREGVYRESEELFRIAIQAAGEADGKVKATLLAVAQRSISDRADILGIKSAKLNVEASGKVEVLDRRELVLRTETSLGLAPGALEEIARQAAVGLSDVARRRLVEDREGRVLDVAAEVVPRAEKTPSGS